MKNAEYVSTVVGAYRAVLDARPAARAQAIKEAEARLTEAYGRETTTGLMKGSAPSRVAAPAAKGGIGRQLGQVERVHGNAVFLTSADVIHVGDRLRIQPQNDLAGSAFTVQELALGQRQVKRAEAGTVVRVSTPFRGLFQAGDQVYKVGGGKTFTLSEEACQRRLAAVDPPPAAVRIKVSCRAQHLVIAAQAAGCRLTEEYEVEMLPAVHSPLNQEALQRTFAKTGHASMRLESLTVDGLPPVVIKPSRLNEVRRDFYTSFSQLLVNARQHERTERIARAQADLLPAGPPRPAGTTTLNLVAMGSRDLAMLEELNPPAEHGAEPKMESACRGQLILPLTPEHVEAVDKQASRLQSQQGQIVWDVPAIIFEGEWRFFQTVIRQLRQRGFSRFRLNNLSHFHLFDGQDGTSLMAGPWLYAVNSQAVLALAGLGAQQYTLSLEDDKKNMAAILARTLPCRSTVVVYSPIPLLTSRIPMRTLRSGAVLAADSGETVRLDLHSGLTVALAGQDFSLLGHLQELRDLGCGEFVVDLSASGLVSKRGQEVLAAARSDQALPGTSLFNFERGLG